MRAKCNDDLSTVNFSTIGLDVHKNRLVACAVHVQHDAKGPRSMKRNTSNPPAHTPVDNDLPNGALHRTPT